MIKDTISITCIAQKVKGCYNKCMARKSFTKRVTRKIKRTLNLDETYEIIRTEFTDSHGNKHIFKMTGNPHKPSVPTIKGTVDYKDDE